MFLHVNVGPKWTFGSHCSFGRRGYLIGSSRRPSSFLTSLSGVSSCRSQNNLSISQLLLRRSLRYTQSPSRLCSTGVKQSLSVPQRRALFFATSANNHDAFRTNVNVRDSEDGRPVPNITSRPLSLPTTSDETIDQTAFNQSERAGEDLIGVSPSSSSVTQNVLLSTSGCRDTNAVSEEWPTNGGPRMKKPVFSSSRARRLPRDFEAELTRLGVLLSEKRGMEHIRDAFSGAISVRDGLCRSHGRELPHWLAGPWDSVKAMQVMQLLLGSIVTSPHEALDVLRSIYKMDDDFSRRCQCLSYIGHMYKDILAIHGGLMTKFDSEVRKLASSCLWPAEEMRRHHLSLLLWRTDGEEAQDLIEQFLRKYPALSFKTRLYLAMYCSRNKMEILALSILTELPSRKLQSPSLLTLRCCQVLLRYDVVESTPDGPNFKFLPRLLEKGLTPDNVLYSRIMERALASGYPGVAWDIFRHLQATDIEITGWTYLILLRHAFDANNVTSVQELMAEIQQKEALYTNVYLLTYCMNILQRIFQQEREMTTAESLSHLLALYDRVFLRDPLVKLDIVPSVGSSKSGATSSRGKVADELIEPDAYCLSFTVWSFVLCNRSGRSVRELWARIQELVEAGDRQIVECMQLDLIYNAFIWLHLKDGQVQSMTAALEVLQYMLSKQLCLPTSRTWSILICGFLRYDRKAQAKHIYGLMKQYDLTTKDIRKEYWRRNWTFEYLEEHLEEILDENMMPDGTELERFSRDDLGSEDVLEKLTADAESSMWAWTVEQDGMGVEMGNRSSLTA